MRIRPLPLASLSQCSSQHEQSATWTRALQRPQGQACCGQVYLPTVFILYSAPVSSATKLSMRVALHLVESQVRGFHLRRLSLWNVKFWTCRWFSCHTGSSTKLYFVNKNRKVGGRKWIGGLTLWQHCFCCFVFSRQIWGDIGTFKHKFPERLWNRVIDPVQKASFEMQIFRYLFIEVIVEAVEVCYVFKG